MRLKAAFALATAVLAACNTTGNGGSTTLDNAWVLGSAQTATGYAAIRQTATAGTYTSFFFSNDNRAASICYAAHAACSADRSQIRAMSDTQTPEGRRAWSTAQPQSLTVGSRLTFYVEGESKGIEFVIRRTANGELDPALATESTTAPGGSGSSGTPAPQPAADPWVPNPDGVQITEIEADIIRQTNMARYQTNPSLRLLVVRADLMNIARQTAAYNAQYNAANRHSGANTYENVYYAQPDARSTVFGSGMGPGWLQHEGHRENLLNPSITGIGAAMYQSADGTPHWVEDML